MNTMTTTRRDVQRALEALVDAADRRGIPHGRFVLEEGSPTYGRAWRLFEMRGDGTGLYEPFGGRLWNCLGWSKAEAEATLRHYRAGLCLVETEGR
jgi:hypothetical protein